MIEAHFCVYDVLYFCLGIGDTTTTVVGSRYVCVTGVSVILL
jgi:hypothetical protein